MQVFRRGQKEPLIQYSIVYFFSAEQKIPSLLADLTPISIILAADGKEVQTKISMAWYGNVFPRKQILKP